MKKSVNPQAHSNNKKQNQDDPMTNKKPKDDDRITNNNNQVTPDMTSEELIESIRGEIQRVLAEKASNPNYSKK